eukprot:3357440-Rhodomonas_salina.2
MAEVCLTEALAYDPTHAGSRYNLGLLLQTQCEFERAKDQFKLCVDANPKHTTAMLSLAQILSFEGKETAAEELRERANLRRLSRKEVIRDKSPGLQIASASPLRNLRDVDSESTLRVRRRLPRESRAAVVCESMAMALPALPRLPLQDRAWDGIMRYNPHHLSHHDDHQCRWDSPASACRVTLVAR